MGLFLRSNCHLGVIVSHSNELFEDPALLDAGRNADSALTGELSYEIYVRAPQLASVLSALVDAADGLDARFVGIYALNSLRLEKGVGIWSREYSRDSTPRMAGLDRFIAYDHPGFIGRDAALLDREVEPAPPGDASGRCS